MLPFLTAQSVSVDLNEMRLIYKKLENFGTVFFPTSRINIAKEAVKQFKLGKANVSVWGTDDLVDRFSEILGLFGAVEANKGSASIEAGWSQQEGAHVGGSVKWEWSKEKQQFVPVANSHGSASVDAGWSQSEGAHVEGSVSITWAKQAANKGSASIDAGWSQSQGAHVGGSVKWEWSKEKQQFVPVANSHGTGEIDAGWSQQEGAHVGGKVSWEWAKKQQPNKGSFSLSAGWSQIKGAFVSGKLKWTWAHDGIVEEVYVDEITTPIGTFYLPTYTEGKFDNLEQKIIDGEFSLD